MNEHDTIDVLTAIAAFDQRTVGEADVQAWTAAARIGGWTTAQAMRAVMEHYTTETNRLMPAHITRCIRARREHYTSTYRHQPYPTGMSDADEQVRWDREQMREYVKARMDAWAHGEDPA